MSSATPFADLLATVGVTEEIELRSTRIGFMAFHGGALEEMTDVIARRAAAASDASYYGVLQPKHLDWHIPSHRVTSDQSPVLDRFLSHVDAVVTLHGYGRRQLFTSLLVGGRNRDLADHVGGHLRRLLPAYDIVTHLDSIPADLRGMHERNPVNVPPGQGVQIELPPRVRGSSALWADWEGPGLTPHTEALIAALTEAAIEWVRAPDAR